VLSLIPLDASGAVRGSVTTIASAHKPILAPRGDWSKVSGGPLLGFTNDDAAQVVALLADDGSRETPAVFLGGGGYFSTAVFSGDGFLYAVDGQHAGVTRIELDGRAGDTKPLGSGLSEYPELAWANDHAVVTFFDQAGGQRLAFRQLDRNGDALSDLVELGRIPNQGNRSPMIALQGGDIALLLGGFSGSVDHTKSLEVARLSAQGETIAAPFVIAGDPMTVTAWRTAQLGSDLVVAWLGSANQTSGRARGGLHLARVTP
jgi:hypothetical protein